MQEKDDLDFTSIYITGKFDGEKKYKEENIKLRNLLYEIRNKLKYKIVVYDGINYRPVKNLSKSEVYKTFAEIRDLLQAGYIFKDNEEAINEIIERRKNEKTKENNKNIK